MTIGSDTQIHLSAIDEERFGIRTARATYVSAGTLPEVLDFCKAHGVILLVARCSVSDLDAVHLMEQQEFLLMDTLVYYRRPLDASVPADSNSEVQIRPLREGEAETVRGIAREAFRGYFGHYHADPRLERPLADDGYQSWAYRSCVEPGFCDQVLIAEYRDRMVGFVTLKLHQGTEGEFVVSGVLPAIQGKGVYRFLILKGMHWFVSRGATWAFTSTQIQNRAPQKVWCRLGFEPDAAYYTFHKWFGEPAEPMAGIGG